jgi:hypothetical protein
MVRTQIQLTEEQAQKLKRMAAEQDTSLSELIRQSVDLLIDNARNVPISERRKRAIAIAGRFRSDEAGENVSGEHDAYLAGIYSS